MSDMCGTRADPLTRGRGFVTIIRDRLQLLNTSVRVYWFSIHFFPIAANSIWFSCFLVIRFFCLFIDDLVRCEMESNHSIWMRNWLIVGSGSGKFGRNNFMQIKQLNLAFWWDRTRRRFNLLITRKNWWILEDVTVWFASKQRQRREGKRNSLLMFGVPGSVSCKIQADR